MSKSNKDELEKLLKNIRSNEQSYVVMTDDVTKLEIMTPNGSGVGTTLKDIITHHDKKMYDSILA
jgi:hypothetical protein